MKLKIPIKRDKLLRFLLKYKLWIFGGALILCLMLILTAVSARNVPEYRLYVAMVGTRADVGTGSAMWSDFLVRTGYDMDGLAVEFNADLSFDDDFDELMDARIVDAVTMTPESLTLYGENGRLMDLSRKECGDLARRYADRLICNSDAVPVGIDISDSLLMTKYNIYAADQGCAIGIGADSRNIDAIKAFLEFIYTEDSENA